MQSGTAMLFFNAAFFAACGLASAKEVIVDFAEFNQTSHWESFAKTAEGTNIENLQDVFNAFDTDSNGELDHEERSFIFMMTENANQGDVGPGKQDIEAFKRMTEGQKFTGDKSAEELFAFIDMDENGFLEEDEHRLVMTFLEKPPEEADKEKMEPNKPMPGQNLEQFKDDAKKAFLRSRGPSARDEEVTIIGKTPEEVFTFADLDSNGMIEDYEGKLMSDMLFAGDQILRAQKHQNDPNSKNKQSPPGMRGGGPPQDPNALPPERFAKRYNLDGQNAAKLFAHFDANDDGVIAKDEEKAAGKVLLFGYKDPELEASLKEEL